MRIAVGKDNFNNIKDFLTYLETTFEQDKLVSEEVTLSLVCDGLLQEEFNELTEFLLKPERPRLYKFKFSPQQGQYQLPFDNVYLMAKRQKFSLAFQHQVELPGLPISFQPPANTIRKTKKNWMEGTKGPSISLQLQYQIQSQQEHPQPRFQKATLRKRKEEPVVGAVVEAEKIRSEDLGELVDRASLDSKRWLSFLKKQLNPGSQLAISDKLLLSIWDRLVGKGANQVKALDRKITHVQVAAMEKIIRNFPEFSYGVLFENLPAGFYLQQTLDGKNVLCFSEAPEHQHPEQITPLTLVPELSPANGRNIVGSYRQFLKRNSENVERYKAEFSDLLSRKCTPERRQEAVVFFLSELTENDALKLKRIKRLLQTLPLSDLNYRGLAQVLIHTGADGVLLLLQQLKTFHEKNLFKDFNEMFLDKPENYLALMSTQGFANLKKLSELNSEQRAWWNSLVAQHKAAGARTEFNELFAAYDYFLRQLENKKLKLPLSCALKNIRHMKPALDRLLFIINNSSDPEEQLTCLDGLDFDVYGAYYASRYNRYKLLSRHMNLKPNVHEEALDYAAPAMPNEMLAWLTRLDDSYGEVISRFYRFIGEQEWAFTLDVYQKIEHEISNNQKLNKQNKILLLSIVALIATGQQVCSKTEDPYAQVKNLLNQFITITEDFDEHLNSQLSTVLLAFLGSLEQCRWESMPTADELHQLIDILLPMQKAKVPDVARQDFLEMSSLALKFMGEYNNAASIIIDNYQRRFAIEQTKTVPIQKFSFPTLLNHLVTPSKLNQFLPALFHDQPESLSQFMVLFSLFDDEIPEGTGNEQEDSEFETKIKNLAQAVYHMLPERRGQLLSILAEINIEASYRLPSLEQLIKTVDSVAKAEEKLGALPIVENQKAGILEIVRAELPNLKVGKEAVNETEITLFSVLRQSYEEWQLESKLANLPEKLKGYLQPWMDAHQVVLYYLKKQPINPRIVFEFLAEEEQEVKNLLGSRWFAWTLSGFPQEKIQMTQALGAEFFTKKSYLAVLKSKIKANAQSSLIAALKPLQTNQDFDNFLLKQIKGLNTDQPIDESLQAYGLQLDVVNGLINSLTRIKNQNNIEFHRCISLLTDGIKSIAPEKSFLTAVQMTNLLDALSQGKTCLVASPLAILCKILNETPQYTAQQLRDALSEVTYLTKYREDLGQEVYENLLRYSFTQNLTQKSLFPLKGMMGLKPLTDADAKHSETLFNALIHVIKKADPDVDAEILQKVIDKITSITRTKTSVQSLVPLLTLLIKTCTKGSKAELTRFYNTVDKLEATEDSDLNNWAKILLILGERATEENIHQLLDVLAGLELNQQYLQEITTLFDYPPYPEIEPFIKILNGYVQDLRAYVDAFDKDPKSGRSSQKNAFDIVLKDSEQVLDEQFESSQVKQVITNIKDIFAGISLSSQEQYDLAQQVTYINAIGRDKPLTLVVGDDPTTKQIKVYKNLTKVSRVELRELSDTLIAALRKPDLEAHEKLKAQLRLLAVLREQYSRATGKFVDATQLIAILMSLKNQQSNMLLEIDNEERNSIAAALFAVMQWVDADGGTIDVCAPSRDLMAQSYKDHAKDFFTSLGIASSSIEIGAPKGTYKVGGINYSTIGDLALYRSRAKAENENLTAYKAGHRVSSNLILYGSDFSELDERILFNLAIRAEGNEGSDNNPYAWIYFLVNEFINQQQFKILHLTNGWSVDQDIDQLKEFLYEYAPTGLHKAQLNALSKDKFSLWINSAIAAQRFVEGEDFVIPPSDTAQHFAIPINQKTHQSGLTFMEHQFLHARLQKAYPDWEFAIAPEMRFVDSVSTKELIDDYKKQGRIVSISRALERQDGLVEQCSKFDMNVACQIPLHQKNKRKEAAAKETANKEVHLHALNEAIKQARNGQPIVILARDAHEVEFLEGKLKTQFTEKNIAAFKDAGQLHENWVKNQSGKDNTITIVTSTLGRKSSFDTKHSRGLLTIQTEMDTPQDTLQIMNHIAGEDKPGRHIVIYEEYGAFLSQSCFYQSEEGRENMLAKLAKLKRQRNEDIAVERYYIQTISSVQQVVLQQFQEWKEFLHLVYPKSEWRTLDAELLAQRDDLTLALSEQWTECLEHSDPQKKYPNPYVRRNRNANKELQTGALDEAVAVYEIAVNMIWDQQRVFLKEKVMPFIAEDSVNALRCHYLEGVSLSEQLQLHRLAEHESKKEMFAQKKKTRRYVESGLEVNGAMLRFADGNVEAYRNAFVKSQVKLFAADISRIIKNNSYLNKTTRSLLVKQIERATNLDILVDLLVDYTNYLPEDRFAEKYALQPIIQELLRVYQQAGLEETSELQDLKTIYLDQVAVEIVDDLESTLSWAMKEHRGLGYFLERSAVTVAADAILNATHILKGAKTLPDRQIAIKNLYKVLTKHEAQLEGLWIFSFGLHKNTHTLIKETLATLDGLVAMSSNENELDADFIHDCKEESLYEVMKGKLDCSIQNVEKEEPRLQKNKEWNAIKNALSVMQAENNTIYGFYEMHYFLANKVEELARKGSKLQEFVIRLRGEVRNLCGRFSEDHKELLNTSKFLTRKADHLKEKLNGLNGFDVKEVKLKEGHNGFSDYFDLVIEGAGSHPLFHNFTQYNSRAHVLIEERKALELRLVQANEQLLTWDRLIKEQLPLLKFGAKIKPDAEQFPKQFQVQVNEILVLKEWVADQMPKDLSSFSEKVRSSFLDRELIKTFKFPDLQAEEIDKIQDIMLRIGFRDLHERIVEGMKPKTTWGSITSYVASYVFTPEDMEDWRLDFNELLRRPERDLSDALGLDIKNKQSVLAAQLGKLYQQTGDQVESLKQQVAFLNEKIDEEEKKGGMYVMRITNPSELLEFEKQLSTIQMMQKAKPVPQLEPKPKTSVETTHPQVDFSDQLNKIVELVM
ncbi:hypothetical protein FOLKNPGA_01032 [Legionella sp. PC1000]|uniref:hypothetical protein n=1 Tax=Legionella sp. PC1000 TaxID=2746060 RepID=UPI0015FABF38|nr:hypothetical protein [Legionella sp. PC1000]QLZ68254.1 hypothetical protein FOLKNPGA_01032 [Legionella sp. PC1000]